MRPVEVVHFVVFGMVYFVGLVWDAVVGERLWGVGVLASVDHRPASSVH